MKTYEEIAREVIRGNWGNGATRRQGLTTAGYDAAKVQEFVNAIVYNRTLPEEPKQTVEKPVETPTDKKEETPKPTIPENEAQLRRYIVATAKQYLDIRSGSVQHQEILKVYNAYRPLPRGYAVKSYDAWCATFVSFVALKCGVEDIMPIECGCPSMIKLYMSLGRWEENDAYVPSAGDVIFYDWNDSSNYATTDDRGTAGHVGIVMECDGRTMKVIEGNVSNAVKTRTLQVNGRYIRGFGLPDYAKKAKTMGNIPTVEPEKEPEKKELDQSTIHQIALEVIQGKWGNGATRRRRLSEAGYDPDTIQAEVNRIYK